MPDYFHKLYKPNRDTLSRRVTWHCWATELGHLRHDLENTIGAERGGLVVGETIAAIERESEWRQGVASRLDRLLDTMSTRLNPQMTYDGLTASLYTIAREITFALSPGSNRHGIGGMLPHRLAWKISVDAVNRMCTRDRIDALDPHEQVECAGCSAVLRWPVPRSPTSHGQVFDQNTYHESVTAYLTTICIRCWFRAFGGRDSDPTLWNYQTMRKSDPQPSDEDKYWLNLLRRETGHVPSLKMMEHRVELVGIAFLKLGVTSDASHLRALSNTYSSSWYKRHYGSYFAALSKLGVLAGACRVGKYGYRVLAGDGHECNSMLELRVEDFLIRHKIKHEKEPRYPAHPTLNPRRLLRADWLVEGKYLELLGMLDNAAYALNAERKRQLARETGIDLLEILPSEVSRLEVVLGSLLGTS